MPGLWCRYVCVLLLLVCAFYLKADKRGSSFGHDCPNALSRELKCCVPGFLLHEGSKTYTFPVNQKKQSTVEADQVANHDFELEGDVEALKQDFLIGLVGGEEDYLNIDT